MAQATQSSILYASSYLESLLGSNDYSFCRFDLGTFSIQDANRIVQIYADVSWYLIHDFTSFQHFPAIQEISSEDVTRHISVCAKTPGTYLFKEMSKVYVNQFSGLSIKVMKIYLKILPPLQNVVYSEPRSPEPSISRLSEANLQLHLAQTKKDRAPKKKKTKKSKKTPPESKHKTELCNSFKKKGHCQYGETCCFAHGQGELKPPVLPPNYKTRLCASFKANSYCKYERRCTFAHGEDDLRPKAS